MTYIRNDEEEELEVPEEDAEDALLDDDLLDEVGTDNEEEADDIEGFGIISEPDDDEEDEDAEDEEDGSDDELEEDAEDVDYDTFDDIDEL